MYLIYTYLHLRGRHFVMIFLKLITYIILYNSLDKFIDLKSAITFTPVLVLNDGWVGEGFPKLRGRAKGFQENLVLYI